MKPILFATALAVLAGCAATADPEPCATLSCIKMRSHQDLSAACRNDLFWYPKRLQRAIDAEYQYPLTSAEGYFDWVRMGGEGPSPQAWCDAYATARMQRGAPVYNSLR